MLDAFPAVANKEVGCYLEIIVYGVSSLILGYYAVLRIFR